MTITHKQLPIDNAKTSVKKTRIGLIASSIDPNKLPVKETLPVDKSGRVNIDSTHPNYRYWIEDDDE
ncbi:hypothetical protein GCM10007063_12500 [Lentibacillus kapialis]|uniref:Uncharacterized protein n=1 Tax=Lentibacillus kapialis TaxID=340214 RepID=A0A917UX18_9BACI|nr:hypothetical protein [Lentibacillus kapialis]GGJ91361.1 hypothetical protein GCM10007063_12500 [Lentibacillus kapialis]